MRGGPRWCYVRRETARRRWSHLGLVAVVALGAGATLGALVLAERTDRAYPDYVRSARVEPLVVNPSLGSNAMGDAIAHFDGVTSVHTDDMLFAGLGPMSGLTIRDVLSDEVQANVQVKGSPDGRYTEVDRPAVLEGRLPTGPDELFVSEDFRPKLEAIVGHPVAVGDEVDVGFLESWIAAGVPDELLDEVVQPEVEHLTVSGFGRLSDEVLPDQLYPREHVIVSADVVQRHACDFPVEESTTPEEFEALLHGCSSLYRYWSLGLAPGTTVDDIGVQFEAAAERLGGRLPAGAQELGVGYFYIPQVRADVDTAVHRSTRPTVTALQAFAAVAGAATVVLTALVVSRVLQRGVEDQRSLLALGASTATRTIAGGAVVTMAALVGLLLAVPIGGLISLAGPLGGVSRLSSGPSWSLPARPLLLVLGVGSVVLLLATALPALGAARRAARPVRTPRLRSAPLIPAIAKASPPVSVGLRAAVGDRRAGRSTAVLAASAVAVTVVVAAVLFGANLDGVIASPPRYGWPWDVGVLTGGGYGDTVPSAVDETLAARDDVVDHRFYNFDPAAVIGGTPTPVVLVYGDDDESPFVMVEGRMAHQPDEVVLGRQTADDLHLRVGDRTHLAPETATPVDATVVGIAVMPSIGPFVSARSGLGVGAILPVADIRDADATAPCDGCADRSPAFVAVRLRPGTDPEAFAAELHDDILGWDASGSPPVVLTGPVRPPEIADVAGLRGPPLLLTGILVVAVVVGLATSVAVSVRDRRRDLAVLRVLGFARRQLAATVRWQALAMVAVGLVIGIPAGIVAGRLAWRRFAESLGLAATTEVPFGWLGVVAVGAVVVGLLAAVWPGRTAARIQPAAALRAQ